MTIADSLRLKKSEGDVGIEIECEGNGLGVMNNQYWRTEDDGSLRGEYPYTRAEYILSKPIPISDVDKAMTLFHASLPKAKFKFSFRTSVHVHVNVQQLEWHQLL